MITELAALLKREYLRWIRAPMWIVAGLLTPILYLALFGQAFNLAALAPPQSVDPYGFAIYIRDIQGAPDYFSYFAVGMVGMVAVTSALFAGTGVIFDKQLGIMQRTIATPTPRSIIFASVLIFRGILVVIPIGIVLGLALLFAHIPGVIGLAITATVTPLGAGEVLLAILVLAMAFTSLFLAFGFVFARVESYFGVVNLLNLPILFTSTALYPQGTAPAWLQNITQYNPVSLAVDVMRENFFASPTYNGPNTGSPPFPGGADYVWPHPAWVYLGGLLVWAVALVVLALLLASRALRTK